MPTTAESEALGRVLGRPAGRLHDAVHRNEGADDNLPRRSLSNIGEHARDGWAGRTSLPAQSIRPAREQRDLCGQPFGGGDGSVGGGCSSVGNVSDIAGSDSSEGNVSVVSAGYVVSSGGGADDSTAGEGVPVSAADSSLLAPQPASSTEPNASTVSVLSMFMCFPLVSLHRHE
jgi:hypothetical protein